jgi:Family of unknown function (DUF5682)
LTVRVYGIRHHGPGSARALRNSLTAWQPDAVLIEGPPEANGLLRLASSPRMRPPVALLGYLPKRSGRAAFYPFASWSPEWVAIHHALRHRVPVTMIDLPVAVFLASSEPVPGRGPPPEQTASAEDAGAVGSAPERALLEDDPLGRLARAAGYDDTERWWEDIVEHRGDEEPWDAITEAVGELRADEPFAGPLDPGREARREACMRQNIRAADKRHQRVAVVCGAWHAPALARRGPARPDADLLTGLTKEKAAVTWVPWTNSRLTLSSGYGAGVQSPGWYEHLFVSPDRPIERWMVKVAILLREERIDAPPASVIDAVRLAESLATMRGRPLAGLSECTDAARAVLAEGHDTVLALIGRKLVVGGAIGEVPPETPMVALAADLSAQQKRLRLTPRPELQALELDLRKDTDLQRSRLLHRLGLLSVPWGLLQQLGRGTGTFREEWSLGWQPELAVRVIEASAYGTTVEAAAAAKATEDAGRAADLVEVTGLVERCLLADLPEAMVAAMVALDRQAALSSDVTELMGAIPALVRVLRYGNVRRTDVDALQQVVRGLVARVCVSLGPAAASLDDAAARTMTARISGVSSALGSLDAQDLRDDWFAALTPLSASAALHGLAAGRCSRILLDAGRISAEEVARHLSATLSRGSGPARGAAWVEGLVAGSGLLLVHDRSLLPVIDAWVSSVGQPVFEDVLPLLRRAFSEFEPAERRLIGAAAARLDGSGASAEPDVGVMTMGDIDEDRAAAIVPLLRLLLGDRG